LARRHISVYLMLLIMAVAVSGLFIGGGQTSQASSSDRSSDSSSSKEKEAAKSLAAPEVSTAVRFDVSPPLGELMRQNPAPDKSGGPEVEMPDFYGGKVPADNGFSGDGAVQKFLGAMAIPTPFVAFDGILNQWSVHPPDPNGDVGPNHYVQMVNLGFRIFDKLGNPLTPVANNNTLWSGFGGPCEVENAGDPIVLHDQLADRWMLTQFSDSGAPFFNCVALSTTADPTGTYYRYAFSAPAFPDYPKYGVWPDAYYLNAREGDTTLGNYALEREQMLVGNPAARVVRFGSGPGYASGNGLLPSDLDGEDLPPAGSPNYFIGTQDDDGAYGAPLDAINIYEFHVDWANTANSTFTGPTTLPVEEFDSNYPCSGRQCIPQPGTTVRVDILSYRQRPTWRAAYRNFGTHESIVTAQSVEAAPAHAGMRWYELRGLAGTPVVYQQGTYSPDTIIHRWMGSIAMDGSGNMALGYSVSNGVDVYPGLRFTGRLASDPLGTMPQGEGIMKVGTGSQTSTGARWGDYTSMTVDPSDDCSFWYTNQFIPTTSSVGWRGAVGAFKFPGCTGSGGTPTPTVTGTPPTATRTPTRTNTPTATNTIQVPANCNPTLITIPDSGPGVPYPSLVNFSGGTSVTDVNVTLNDVTHSYPDDVDILLVGPAGQSVILMSDAGGSNDVTDVDLTFDDEATATLPDSAQIVAGSYDPTNYLTGDTFPAPAPGGPYGTTMSVFDGTNPNGNWSLYVVDDLGGDEGQIAGGWCLTLTTSGGATNTPTNTPQPPTSTATATEPAIPTSTVTSTSTPIPPCTIEFADVPPTHTFYPFVHCLACQGIISGYPCGGTGEPCNANNDPYYRPDNPVTRGQIAKIMSESAGFSEPVPSTQQSFEDVPYGSTFWEYIERLYTRSVIGGYQCGINPAEPCIPPDNRPYFRPNAGATRGQLVKIASESAGFTDVIPPGQYSFTDVEPGHTFWIYIERLLLNRPGAIAGYPCGGPGEPCDSENRPYFRPNNGVTRGQASKIVANTFFPACTPGRP
jgi:subtilisin-like proprotein convertase family protein